MALEAVVCQHPTIARVTGGLAVAWNTALIDSVSQGVPKGLNVAVMLGRTLKKRAADVLAYFDRLGTSNGPTEAINGRLEHLRGSALGFRNLNYTPALGYASEGGDARDQLRASDPPLSTSGKPGSSPST